jgi:hypothetical protein
LLSTIAPGGTVSFVQKLLIERLIKIRLRLDPLEEKAETGEWTDLDRRTYGALLNAERHTAREIGLKPTAEKPPSLSEHLARSAAEREAPAS